MPAISTTPTRVSGESKLNVVLAIAPRSKSKIAVTYVGTLTSKTSPARSPVAMVRVGAADAATRRDAGDRAEQLDQCREVVGPDVENWPAAGLEQELGVGMPVVRAGVLKHHRSGEWLADVATIDEPPDGLPPGPEERVGSTADEESGGVGLGEDCRAGLPIEGQRLLVPHVLASCQHGRRYLGMGGRDRQVDDELHGLVGEQRLDRPGAGHAEPFCHLLALVRE